jgi:hypothetical protein
MLVGPQAHAAFPAIGILGEFHWNLKKTINDSKINK